MKIRVLVVEDEADHRDVMRHNLEGAGYDVCAAEDGAVALRLLVEASASAAPIDVVVADVTMPVMDGHALLAAVRADPSTAEVPFMFLTARGTAADKLEGFRGGADDYLIKPADVDELLARVCVLARRAAITRRVRVLLRPETATTTTSATASEVGDLYAKVALWELRFPRLAAIREHSIVGASASTLRLLRDVLVNAGTGHAVLIIGETGSGKTGVAHALHELGPRAAKPFREINCATLSAGDPTITLAKLFGYGKGSGIANVNKDGEPGLLEEVDGGTLFLDEVHRLPAQAQGQLLLAIEGRPFSRAVGRSEPRTVDVKFVFATNVDLLEEARAGRFPFDLYQRLAQGQVRVPSLAERRDDIEALADHFLEQCKAETGLENPTLSPSLIRHLVERDYPGNIRELGGVVRAIARNASFEEDNVLTLEHLPAQAGPASAAPPAATTTATAPVKRRETASDPPGLWNEVEMRDLDALRRHRFRIVAAERELGYSDRSRTLTNHLRGLCFKALVLAAFDLPKAARVIVGSDDDALIARTVERMESYLAIVEKHVVAHTVATLRNNLQHDYRRHLDAAIDRVRDRLAREGGE